MKTIFASIPHLTILALFTFLNYPRTVSGQQTAELFNGQAAFQYEYLLHLPEGYESHEKESYPFILFLHGAGERGDDLSQVKKHGPPKFLD